MMLRGQFGSIFLFSFSFLCKSSNIVVAYNQASYTESETEDNVLLVCLKELLSGFGAVLAADIFFEFTN